MKNKIRFLSFILLSFLLVAFPSCGDKYSADAKALANYMQFFDQPENLPILSMEKAEFSNEVYYYISRGPYDSTDPDAIDLIIVYNKETKTYKRCFLLDIQFGLNADVGKQWESRSTSAISTHVFTDEEIESVTAEAIDYCKTKKH